MATATEATSDDKASARRLIEMIMGFRQTQLIHVAAKLGIADLLAHGPRSSRELAQATSADERNLYRLLRALASLGIFAELEGRLFELTPLAQLLRQDAPGSVHGVAVLYGEPFMWQAYGALGQTVQSGTTAFEVAHGASLFDYLSDHPASAQIFQQAMTSFSAAHISATLAAYKFDGVRHVVDIGGGEGALLTALLAEYPAAEGTLFDLPVTIDRVRQQHALAPGSWARCTLVAGDFFDGVPAGGDLYVMKQIIHDWQDEECITILRHCHTALGGAGKVLILDRVIEAGNQPSDAKLFDINMMVTAGGLERTPAEFAELLDTAGFRLTQIIATASPMSIVEAVPK